MSVIEDERRGLAARRTAPERPLRVAWQGPFAEGGGVSYAGLQLIRGLRDLGVEVDCYMTEPPATAPAEVREDGRIGLYSRPRRWEWNRWYSRDPLSAFITGQAASGAAQLGLARLIAREHAKRPYDVLYRYSQIELFGVRSQIDSLPPIIVHPEVHAAGELTWHRRERTLSIRAESRERRAVTRAMLIARSARQRRDLRLVRRVVAPSHVFASHLSNDYGIPPERISVVPNPIDLDRYAPPPGGAANGSARTTLLFVSRLSVRKGLDLIIGLSHRLADIEDRVEIQIIGDRSLWSDYRPLLADLNPAVATYVGSVDPTRLAAVYAQAGALLQPSQYEPFALTVGEALASGIPVVASDEVGATEGVDRRCCTVFAAGDLDAFEASVRSLLARIAGDERLEMRRIARAEAERLFSPQRVARGVLDSIDTAVNR
jgi:glycosyltransferase involved in cell wall biosynthesis